MIQAAVSFGMLALMDIGGCLVRITSIYMLLLFIHLVDQVIVISVPPPLPA